MTSLHHIKLTLRHIQPAISRELLVPSDIRLDCLHHVIQVAMGWEDSHLHEFSNGVRGRGERRFGPPELDGGFFAGGAPAVGDECEATLADLAPRKGAKFVYWYDFGDDWLHDATVKAVVEPGPEVVVPSCLSAVGAGPPEDCGGPWRYAELLEVLRDPSHEEYDEMREWVGGDWDPEHVDLAQINRKLQVLFGRGRRAPKKSTAKKSTSRKSTTKGK